MPKSRGVLERLPRATATVAFAYGACKGIASGRGEAEAEPAAPARQKSKGLNRRGLLGVSLLAAMTVVSTAAAAVRGNAFARLACAALAIVFGYAAWDTISRNELGDDD